MARAYLALGANIGDPAAQIEKAVEMIAATPGIALVARSRMIASPPWGKLDQDEFRNMVVAVETDLAPQALLAACLSIELGLGRRRIERWGPRLIDIDIVAYDRLELAEDNLTIPHRHAHERAFVLEPLREIAPDMADWLVSRAATRPEG